MHTPRTHSPIKKAVILAGGQRTILHPLGRHCPTSLLPVLNKPLMTYTLDFLKRNGIEEVVIAISEHHDLFYEIRDSYIPDLRIHIHIETRPRGTAGALKDLDDFIGDDIFLVLNGSVLVEDIDLLKAREHFYKTNSAALIGISKENRTEKDLETVNISNGCINTINKTHPSEDRRSPWRTSGIYILDPAVLNFIDRNLYMDLKEQLVPALQKKNLTVSAYEVEGCHTCVFTANDYFVLQRDILLIMSNRTYYWPIEEMEEISDRVWVGKNAKISQKAYLLGPLVIGDDCEIEDWSQIIGPSVVGKNCRISSGALLHESVIHDNVLLGRNSKVEYSIVFSGSEVRADLEINNMLAASGMNTSDANLMPSDYRIQGIATLSGITSIAGQTHNLYKGIKRLMDLALSAAALVVFLPVFLIIAAAIKADSDGPVFYGQKRCGRGGRHFKMIKFRSMVADAEKYHEDLIALKNIDGPMFKMEKDPRVTKVGAFLRKTSLDEIPQLINVLRGEMSLVGPRPLIMDEMKFNSTWRDTRLKVKPGITGLWQVQGRSEASFHDWIRHDVYYVKNQSLLLDFYILIKTISVVFKKVGAY